MSELPFWKSGNNRHVKWCLEPHEARLLRSECLGGNFMEFEEDFCAVWRRMPYHPRWQNVRTIHVVVDEGV